MKIEKELESLCCPVLNTQCSKNNCYINGGQCYQTVFKKYTQKELINKLNKIIELFTTDDSVENIFYAIGAVLEIEYFDIEDITNKDILKIIEG